MRLFQFRWKTCHASAAKIKSAAEASGPPAVETLQAQRTRLQGDSVATLEKPSSGDYLPGKRR